MIKALDLINKIKKGCFLEVKHVLDDNRYFINKEYHVSLFLLAYKYRIYDKIEVIRTFYRYEGCVMPRELRDWLNLVNDSSYFNIFYYKKIRFVIVDQIRKGLIEYFISIHERYYDFFNSYFGEIGLETIDIFVYKDYQDNIGNTLSYCHSALSMIHTNIGFTSAHELAHLFWNNLFPEVVRHKFIDEGLAEYSCYLVDDIIEILKESTKRMSQYSIEDIWGNYYRFNQKDILIYCAYFIYILMENSGREELYMFLHNPSFDNFIDIYGDFKGLNILDMINNHIRAV